MRGGRNNLLAGMLVIVSVIGAVIVVVLLAGGLERLGKQNYLVRFAVADGVTGLEPGSAVLVGGRQVGVVDNLRFDLDADGGVESLTVTVSIDRGITLEEGAVAYLISPLLGGSGTINFPSTGDGRKLTGTDLIPGRIAPPTILAQAGYGEEQARQVQRIIANVDEASEKLNTVLDDARTVIADFRSNWPTWSERVESITKNIDETTAKGPAIADDLQKRLEEVRDLLATAQGYLDENRENVKSAIASFRNIGGEGEAFMERLNGELVDKAVGFLDSGGDALSKVEKAVDSVQGLLDEHTPNVRRMMANFRLASDQLSATLAEVRRSPWRLLYRPDQREMEFELLYDSARVYAAAVSDLRTAAEIVQSFPASSAMNGSPRAADLIAELDRAFNRYKEAEAEFLRQIMLHAQGK